MARQTYHVDEQMDAARLDKVLVTLNPQISRNQVQAWIKDGFVTVNGNSVKPNYKCQENDLVDNTRINSLPMIFRFFSGFVMKTNIYWLSTSQKEWSSIHHPDTQMGHLSMDCWHIPIYRR